MITKERNFKKGSLFDGIRKFVGEPLFVLEGEKWNKHRTSIKPLFRTENLEKMFESFFVTNVNIFIENLEKETTIELQNEISLLSIDILSESVFGKKINAQINRKNTLSMQNDIQFVIKNILLASVPGSDKIPYFLFVMKERCRNLFKVVKTGSENNNKNSLRELLLKSNCFTEKEIDEESIGFILAGFETTSSLITWAIIELSRNEIVMEKVFFELDNVLSDGRFPTWQDVRYNFPYLTCVIWECLRFYPPALFINRTASEDTEICGYFIPKNVSIIIFV